MLLILSSEYDKSTNDIIDWFYKDFVRINKENYTLNLNLSLTSIGLIDSQICLKGTNLNFDKISSFWYRRDDFFLGLDALKLHNIELIKQNFDEEWESLKMFLHFYFENKNSIGSYGKEKYHNKLQSLFVAQSVGIRIPSMLITSEKNILQKFIEKQGDSITKAISNMFTIEKNGFFQTIGTQLVTQKMIDTLDETFFPTLIQKKIEKIFELRIFYLKGQFYPMAIFSQTDEQTQLDYRNYNRTKPNRNIPFVLPNDIEIKLQVLMNKLDLNTGSIDMMVTREGEYVFLEVNPTGQFGWVSENCNYYLEEKIAHCLEGRA